ncbi:hypothetical protein FOA22_13940 [Heyndrickxia oleronia]|uniref:hypothetical protein n=1 Tax=Heyndrickxia oleronia TaxID=38875 RepID=UPI003338A360
MGTFIAVLTGTFFGLHFGGTGTIILFAVLISSIIAFAVADYKFGNGTIAFGIIGFSLLTIFLFAIRPLIEKFLIYIVK